MLAADPDSPHRSGISQSPLHMPPTNPTPFLLSADTILARQASPRKAVPVPPYVARPKAPLVAVLLTAVAGLLMAAVLAFPRDPANSSRERRFRSIPRNPGWWRHDPRSPGRGAPRRCRSYYLDLTIIAGPKWTSIQLGRAALTISRRGVSGDPACQDPTTLGCQFRPSYGQPS